MNRSTAKVSPIFPAGKARMWLLNRLANAANFLFGEKSLILPEVADDDGTRAVSATVVCVVNSEVAGAGLLPPGAPLLLFAEKEKLENTGADPVVLLPLVVKLTFPNTPPKDDDVSVEGLNQRNRNKNSTCVRLVVEVDKQTHNEPSGRCLHGSLEDLAILQHGLVCLLKLSYRRLTSARVLLCLVILSFDLSVVAMSLHHRGTDLVTWWERD